MYFVLFFLIALIIVLLVFGFYFSFRGCLDLFKYREYRFLSVVLLVLCVFTFTFLCVLGGMICLNFS